MQNRDLLYIEIYNKIQKASNILILTHINPDGDCLGASNALSIFINSINKKNSILVNIIIPENLKFLDINNAVYDYNDNYDLFIMLDANNIKRCGYNGTINDFDLIIFDHHKDLEGCYEKALKIIDESSSSTCEIIFNFLTSLSIKIDKNMANSIMTGILTDTNNFINQATNKNAIKIAEKLIKFGANTSLINKNINKNNNINIIRFLEIVLERIKINKKLNIVSTYFTIDDLNKFNLNSNNIPSVVGLLNNLYNYNFVMVIKDMGKNELEFSLRTNTDIDLSKISSLFGGGGHKKAAGFKIKGNIKDLIF